MAAQLFVFCMGAACAIWYGVALTHGPVSYLRSAIKTLSTVLLFLLGLMTGAPALILLGLALGALGDYFLSRDRDTGFLPGLASFLAGHIAYVVWSAQQVIRAAADIEFDWLLAVDAAIFLGLVAYVLGRLWPHLGAFRSAVCLYTGISALLGLVALAALESGAGQLFAFGAGLFILSDVILAFQLFVMSSDARWYRPASSALWALYWAGQATILFGALYWGQLPA